ncbi:MAG TPA: DoxX family membrane protein [Acidothermaceae bacterium]|jgi:uncharacterized membrane protein YphA (DoxX/SURF4 family)
MNPLRTLARVLTGWTYIALGFDTARKPGTRVDRAAGTLATLRKAVPLPGDDELIVRANGAAQVLAGGALAVGKAPRFSALVLLASLIPTTAAGHAFWSIEDPQARKAQRVQFHKNMALLGGLLFAILDRPRRARRPTPTAAADR